MESRPSPAAGGLSERLRSNLSDLVAARARLLAGAPWSLAARFDHSGEAAWGPPEVLAHVGEMLPYWLGEVERVLDGAARGGEPVPFGRVAVDEVRIALIGRDRTVPIRELLSRIETDAERVARRIDTLDQADLARRGLHPARGEMTVEHMLGRFVVDHLAEHTTQIAGLLEE
jgi:hypothetical protein